MEKIRWLNDNRDKVIDVFMEDNYQYVDVINDMIVKGTFRAYEPISENDFSEAPCYRQRVHIHKKKK